MGHLDLSDPWLLISGLIVGSVGTGIFVYGKKQESIPAIFGGTFITVFPVFATSVAAVWIAFAAALGALYAISRLG